MQKQIVVITGAGSGLGREMAMVYAQSGACVAVVDIVSERAEQTLAMLPGSGHKSYTTDVGDDASVLALRDAVLRDFGGVSVLINNAGIASAGKIAEVTPVEWQRVLNVNLTSVYRGVAAFVPTMEKAGRGCIINIASFAGIAAAPGLGAYGVTKAAVIALSEGLRAEVQPHGITVSVVCPSFFKTNLLESFRGDGSAKFANTASKLMERSVINAGDVARIVQTQAAAGRFMIFPHNEARTAWRFKRFFPERFFRAMLKRYF
jgi:NAD(P)-dependent dehydrogenase (short-subunit alcohol dehydrogenase family)